MMKWKESKREASINVTVIKGLVRDVTGGPIFWFRIQGMLSPFPFRVPGLRSQGLLCHRRYGRHTMEP